MNPKGAIISRISFASLPLGTCLGPCRYQGICHPAHSSALFPQQTQGDVLPANPSPYLRSFPGIVGPLLFLGFFFFFSFLGNLNDRLPSFTSIWGLRLRRLSVLQRWECSHSPMVLAFCSPSVAVVGLKCDLFLRATLLSGSLQ